MGNSTSMPVQKFSELGIAGKKFMQSEQLFYLRRGTSTQVNKSILSPSPSPSPSWEQKAFQGQLDKVSNGTKVIKVPELISKVKNDLRGRQQPQRPF